MQCMSIAELALWRSGHFTHTLLDVRRQAKRQQDGVEIAGGKWLNPALWLDWKDQIEPVHLVVIYCAYGHEISQGLAATLCAMGIDARFLTGGIEAWRHAGEPVRAIQGLEP